MSNNHYIGTELELFANANNWKNYWSSRIKPLLGATVLEVGAGVGANLVLLKTKHQQWTALEPDPNLVLGIRQRCEHRPDTDEINISNGTIQSVSFEQQFNSIIYIDVLEHIEQDASELEEALTHLHAGGKLIILAPAHQALFSPFDASVGHYRRYNKTMMRALQPENTKVEQLYYLDSVGYLASWLNAKILKSGMPTQTQIQLWDSIMVPLSRVLDSLLGRSFGKTIVMVLTKIES